MHDTHQGCMLEHNISFFFTAGGCGVRAKGKGQRAKSTGQTRLVTSCPKEEVLRQSILSIDWNASPQHFLFWMVVTSLRVKQVL